MNFMNKTEHLFTGAHENEWNYYEGSIRKHINNQNKSLNVYNILGFCYTSKKKQTDRESPQHVSCVPLYQAGL